MCDAAGKTAADRELSHQVERRLLRSSIHRLPVMEEPMADEQDRGTRGILGDINPAPSARDHKRGTPGHDEADGEEQEQSAGSRDVTGGTTGNAGTETGGTRNYRTGTGHTGGDIGNRPE